MTYLDMGYPREETQAQGPSLRARREGCDLFLRLGTFHRDKSSKGIVPSVNEGPLDHGVRE